nr:hypothetical protein OG409_18515 [Streptomyces sp. NBC_00974]
MTHVLRARSQLRRITALFVTAALASSLSVVVTLTSAKDASALCVASPFSGRWRSSDNRLSRIDLWQGEDCQLYAKAWSTCEGDATHDCSWGSRSKLVTSTPDRNFRFFSYSWNNASEVLQMRLQGKTHMSVWDHTEYNSGKQVSFTAPMVKD